MQYKREQFLKDSKKVSGSIFTVPEEYTSLQVECFEDSKFSEIILPSKIKFIPRRCFGGSQIESIVIPDSVINIYESAFARCTNLKDIKLSKNLTTIGDMAFYDTQNLFYIKLPDQVFTIGSQCFLSSGINKIDFNDKLNLIGCQAFTNCQRLESLNFKNTNIKYFPQDIFKGSKNLKTLYLPINFTQDALDRCNLFGIFNNSYIEKICKSGSLATRSIVSKSGKIEVVNYEDMSLDEILELSKSFKEANKIYKEMGHEL